MIEKAPSSSRIKQVRLLLWAVLALAIAGAAALLLSRGAPALPAQSSTARSVFGGPFTLIGSDGKPFSSAKLLGKPYAMYFGYTRCADVCPTTLWRMVKLRRQVGGDDKFKIVFVTIDPTYDGPKQVGQYAVLFNSPIVGLTGSTAQINQMKRQFGIFAQAVPNAPMGQQMQHSAIVLLFDRNGQFVSTISPNEPDADALAKIKKALA